MKIIEKYEDGPILIEPTVYYDDRGWFCESFNERDFKEQVADVTFVQDNKSQSKQGTIRGMHFQRGEHAQAKLVCVTRGSVMDVAVDIRPNSKNYLKVYSAYLSNINQRQFFIPRGFAHGFIALEDNTILQYKCDNYYNKASEGSFNIKDVNFDWGQYVPEECWVMSQKDKDAPQVSEADFESFEEMLPPITHETSTKTTNDVDLEKVKRILDGSAMYDAMTMKLVNVPSPDILKGLFIESTDGEIYEIYDVVTVCDPTTFGNKTNMIGKKGDAIRNFRYDLEGVKRIFQK